MQLEPPEDLGGQEGRDVGDPRAAQREHVDAVRHACLRLWLPELVAEGELPVDPRGESRDRFSLGQLTKSPLTRLMTTRSGPWRETDSAAQGSTLGAFRLARWSLISSGGQSVRRTLENPASPNDKLRAESGMRVSTPA